MRNQWPCGHEDAVATCGECYRVLAEHAHCLALRVNELNEANTRLTERAEAAESKSMRLQMQLDDAVRRMLKPRKRGERE